MLTLPQIVSQIREQKPGVVPEWLVSDQHPMCGNMEQVTETKRVGMSQRLAIFVLEAALWREYHRYFNPLIVECINGNWTTRSVTRGLTCHSSDPLALIRAICHAIGVTLTEADCPHRRTSRDASGATVCLDCQEDISRG